MYFVDYPLVTRKGTNEQIFLRSLPFSSPEMKEVPFVKSGIVLAVDFSNPSAAVMFLDWYNNVGFSGGPIVVYHKETKLFQVVAVVSSYPWEKLPVITVPSSSSPKDGQPPMEKEDESRFVQAHMGIVTGFSIHPMLEAIRKNPIGPKDE